MWCVSLGHTIYFTFGRDYVHWRDNRYTALANIYVVIYLAKSNWNSKKSVLYSCSEKVTDSCLCQLENKILPSGSERWTFIAAAPTVKSKTKTLCLSVGSFDTRITPATARFTYVFPLEIAVSHKLLVSKKRTRLTLDWLMWIPGACCQQERQPGKPLCH